MPAQNLTLRVAGDPADHEAVIVRFLKDYFAGAGRRHAVLGLSGGIDSAVSAALACRALGSDHVTALVMPTATSSAQDLQDAEAVAQTFGFAARTVSIQAAVDALEAQDPGFDRAGRGNAAARVRMVHLYEAARRLDALVVGTGNKSEFLTGYFTRWGDGGVDVQPLGDLYKTQVRALADHLGVPGRVRAKEPSAGLWEGQTDEAELGLPYEVLDRILLGLEVRLPIERIAEAVGVPRAEVERVHARRVATQFKRRTPMIPKLGLRTPGFDWRDATVR